MVARANGDVIEVTGDGLKPVQSGLSDKAAPNIKIRRGAVIRISKGAKNWEITQLPEVEGAFVALDPRSGAIKALVGGSTSIKTSSITPLKPGDSQGRVSNPSSTRQPWRKALLLPR